MGHMVEVPVMWLAEVAGAGTSVIVCRSKSWLMAAMNGFQPNDATP